MRVLMALLATAAAKGDGPASFSWDTLPTAFHGANMSGDYRPDQLAQLAKYNMVTIEKWMGACAAQHAPLPMSRNCSQEAVISRTLRSIRALQPYAGKKHQALNMYLNSNFAFTFYELTTQVAAADGLLRGSDGKICRLNNDGNFYLDVPFYDWAQPKVQAMWQAAATKHVRSGVADGFFSDHASQAIRLNASTGKWNVCNGGKGKLNTTGRRCCEVTEAHALAVNAGHTAALRATQQALGWKGLLINHAEQVPRSSANSTIWGDLINLPTIPKRGKLNARLRTSAKYGYAVEVRVDSSGYGPPDNGMCNQGGKLDESMLASFLIQAADFQYWACFKSQGGVTMPEPTTRTVQTALPPWFPEYDKPLGKPKGQAVLGEDGVLTREFESGTTATFNAKTGVGSVQWSGE